MVEDGKGSRRSMLVVLGERIRASIPICSGALEVHAFDQPPQMLPLLASSIFPPKNKESLQRALVVPTCYRHEVLAANTAHPQFGIPGEAARGVLRKLFCRGVSGADVPGRSTFAGCELSVVGSADAIAMWVLRVPVRAGPSHGANHLDFFHEPHEPERLELALTITSMKLDCSVPIESAAKDSRIPRHPIQVCPQPATLLPVLRKEAEPWLWTSTLTWLQKRPRACRAQRLFERRLELVAACRGDSKRTFAKSQTV